MPKKPKPDQPKGFKVKEAAEVEEIGKAPSEDFGALGELPHGYGVDTIFLIAQEPHWLFTYWDIDITKHPGGAACLRYYAGESLEGEVEVPFETRNWYLPVKLAATEYFVEIGYYRDAKWKIIARSVPVTTPPDSVTASEDFDYATIPFHLSFQRLIDNLESATRAGEDLLSAVARLQQNGDFSAFGNIGFCELLTEDQRTLLSTLLGEDFQAALSSGAFSSGDIESKIRSFLDDQISSAGGSSEWLSSFRELISSFGGTAPSSETAASFWSPLTSQGAAASSWGSLGSWGETTSGAGAVLTSWTASAFASWAQAALTSWSQAAVSSWTIGGESSGSLVSMSSWLSGVQSSWAQAALASWSSAEVSSWFSAAATTSWSGASETLTSFGERGFFMHVNAEVIFYGGTDPRAKVTINGHPIVLNSDGTFRYHFVFPNADYRIDIVAESPDKVETRSATLDFHRSTAKIGEVTDTPQPSLGEPMGRL